MFRGADDYLSGIVALAHFLHTHRRVSRSFFKVRFANDFILFLGENVAAADYWDEILRLTNFALEAFPDLVSSEDWNCVGWVDRFGVGAVYGDHFGCLSCC